MLPLEAWRALTSRFEPSATHRFSTHTHPTPPPHPPHPTPPHPTPPHPTPPRPAPPRPTPPHPNVFNICRKTLLVRRGSGLPGTGRDGVPIRTPCCRGYGAAGRPQTFDLGRVREKLGLSFFRKQDTEWQGFPKWCSSSKPSQIGGFKHHLFGP